MVPGLPVPDKYIRTFTSVPQAGLDNRTNVLYTGAVVGGGTVVNGMFFNRGSAADYDAWERLGNPGWGWEGLLTYFKKVSVASTEQWLDVGCDWAMLTGLSCRARHSRRRLEIQDAFPGVISDDLSPHGTHGPVGSSFSHYQYPVIRK